MHYKQENLKEKVKNKKTKKLAEEALEYNKENDELKKSKKSAVSAVSLFLVIAIICSSILFLNNYYHTAEYPKYIPEFVDVTNDNGAIILEPKNPIAAIIFYQGAKVENTAYEGLMLKCAEKRILCIIVDMPFNIAFFGQNSATKYREEYSEKYPGITWYLAGHSLGGVVAANYLSKNADDYSGLILLGSYVMTDLSETDLAVLSVYGTEDKVLSIDKYEKKKSNLPIDFEERIIEGGCHSYFGNYGMQKGDGVPTIERDEQEDITADAIYSFILNTINLHSF